MALDIWDREAYVRQQKLVHGLYEELDQRNRECQLSTWQALKNRWDTDGALSRWFTQYMEVTARVLKLEDTMKVYLQEKDEMMERGRKLADNIEEVEGRAYSSFGGLMAASGPLEMAYENSMANRASQTGQTFSGDFSDIYSFVNSSTFQEGSFFSGLGDINSYKLYYQYFTGQGGQYADNQLEAAMCSMLEGIPGREATNISNIDWDALGRKMGIDGLDEIMEPIKNLIQEYKKGTVTKSNIKEAKGALSTIKNLSNNHVLTSLLEGLIDGVGVMGNAADNIDSVLDIVFAYANTYEDQIAYLDTLEKSMLASGCWAEGPVIQKIQELREHYDSNMNVACDKIYDVVIEKFSKGAQKAVLEQIPVLKDIDMGLSAISDVAKAGYGVDEIKAIQSIQGFYQYDRVLTDTYEKYAQLIVHGAASAEDVAEADRLLEMLYTTKMKEYAAMATIGERHDRVLYEMAQEKLKELEELGRFSGLV